MRKLKSLTVVVLLLLSQYPLTARHIVGGEITYKYLGNSIYEFVMRMYRDCNCVECAPFDTRAEIGVYQCGTTVDCGNLSQNQVFARASVPISSQRNVEAPDYPCLIPPDVCVEEAVYVWQMELPKSSESYFIAYQRCCRNVTINNIFAPQATGATYMVEITPLAQELDNNSPVFDEFPPTVICAGAPLNFDHSATDPDGDQLVYEFCSPLEGGDNNLDQQLLTTCIGAAPTPACAPPYTGVSFRAPDFSPLFPLGSDADFPVNIDPRQGIIRGTPEMLGQFVVGVCVSEYRNGELLSRISRDFQFNVASCDPQVVADVREDFKVADQEFVINSCGVNTVTFENESYLEQFIDEFEWSFDISGATQFINEWNPTVTFPGVGTYTGELRLNEGTDCGDTAYIRVNVFPDISADFSFEYDTCVAGPVQFTDLSSTGSCCLTDWDWSFGEGGVSIRQNPIYNYRTPGVLPVTLTVRDTNQCEESITKNLSYFPIPSLIVIAPSDYTGCAPAEIFFDNLSFPIDSTYDIRWNFGDGGTSSEISPFYTYQDPGTYTVDVSIVSPIGCETDTTYGDLITVLPSPEAGFSFSPEDPSILRPQVSFQDESSGAINWRWSFGTNFTSNLPSPSYTFPDTGRYQVNQVVTHQSGCQDTATAIIDIVPEVRYFLPNAFTPNSDSRNDLYMGEGIMEGANNFRMTIWNRWGELVFETTDPNKGWNGRKLNTGRDSPNGVYVVHVSYNEPRGELVELKGYATLIR